MFCNIYIIIVLCSYKIKKHFVELFNFLKLLWSQRNTNVKYKKYTDCYFIKYIVKMTNLYIFKVKSLIWKVCVSDFTKVYARHWTVSSFNKLINKNHFKFNHIFIDMVSRLLRIYHWPYRLNLCTLNFGKINRAYKRLKTKIWALIFVFI